MSHPASSSQGLGCAYSGIFTMSRGESRPSNFWGSSLLPSKCQTEPDLRFPVDYDAAKKLHVLELQCRTAPILLRGGLLDVFVRRRNHPGGKDKN